MFDVVIIGGGPIGLNLAIKLKEMHKKILIVEGGEFLGGQLTNLYPEKLIVDIPNQEPLKAKEYISLLANKLNHDDFHLNEKAVQIIENKNSCIVVTSSNEYETKNVVIATGLGFSHPRPLGLDGEEKYPTVLYSLKDYSFLKDKKVAIFGGGDSALDWAEHIEKIAAETYLVHRRDEFRGNSSTIENCKNLNIHLSYVPNKFILENDSLKGIQILSVKDQKTVDLYVDYILVNYGNIASMENFGLKTNGAFIEVLNNKASNRIYVVGDAASYEGKIRRIGNGLSEITKIINQL